MILSNVLFLFYFLPIFMISYFATPRRMKNFVLLLGSLFFYAWGEPVYVVLLVFSTLCGYIHGLLIEGSRGRTSGHILLTSAIVIHLFLLGFFKYADVVIGALNSVAGTEIPALDLPVPIGISFYTLQIMSYIIDVYRGECKAQRNLLQFSVFTTMFPQLLAGPIVKYHHVESDLAGRNADPRRISKGMRRFVRGLAKKVLLADNLNLLWTEVSLMAASEMSVLAAWLGIMAFSFRIYFDFSGYSDMAIGLGEMLGFRLPENFNYPYISRSVTEFWRRWHMTLGSWLREYVYIPLGGSRRGRGKQLRNILIVWLLTGIWHGGKLNYLLWALWFAVILILEKLFLRRMLKSLPGVFGGLYTMVVVLAGWVLFAHGTPVAAWEYLRTMFGFGGVELWNSGALFLGREYLFFFLAAVLASLPWANRIRRVLHGTKTGPAMAVYRLVEKVCPALLLLLSIAYVVTGNGSPFLYIQL